MKVEIAGAAAFAALGLLAGALLRPQAGDFRQEADLAAAGFTAPPEGLAQGPSGGADPTGGWGARAANGRLPDWVVGTDSLNPPVLAPSGPSPPPAWEEETAGSDAVRPADESDLRKTQPAPTAETAPAAAPAPDARPAPQTAPDPASPSPPERPKEGE